MYKEFKRIRFNDDLTLDIAFWGGEFKRFDMKKHIEESPSHAFMRELLNIDLFKNPMEIESDIIRWSDKSDLDWEFLYHRGGDIEPFEGGCAVKLPPTKRKMRMKRARFNADFTIDVVFEENEVKRYDFSQEMKDKICWKKTPDKLEVFLHPDTFTRRMISWSNGDWTYGHFIYTDGIPASPFDGGIKREY